MKLLYVVDGLYPYVKGGSEVYMHELGLEMARRGFKVTFLTFNWHGRRRFRLSGGVEVLGVGRPIEFYSRLGTRRVDEAFFFSLCLTKALLSEVRRLIKDVDLIHTTLQPYLHLHQPLLKHLPRRPPLIATVWEYWGGYWFSYFRGFFKPFLASLVERYTLPIPDYLITTSKLTMKRILEAYPKPLNVKLIPPGINLRLIDEAPIAKECFDVICVSRLVKQKNLELLIEAIKRVSKRIPKVSCCIIGDGPEKARLLGLIDRYGLRGNVVLKGSQPRRVVYSLEKASKIMVHPSLREGFGFVVLEANACGLPVVVVKSPFNASMELVEEGVNGFKVSNNPYELARVIEELLVDEGLRLKLSRGARRVAELYDWGRRADDFKRFYEEVVEASS